MTILAYHIYHLRCHARKYDEWIQNHKKNSVLNMGYAHEHCGGLLILLKTSNMYGPPMDQESQLEKKLCEKLWR